MLCSTYRYPHAPNIPRHPSTWNHIWMMGIPFSSPQLRFEGRRSSEGNTRSARGCGHTRTRRPTSSRRSAATRYSHLYHADNRYPAACASTIPRRERRVLEGTRPGNYTLPTYSLTTTLKRLTFLIYCKYYDMTPRNTANTINGALSLSMQEVVNHAFMSDLGLPEMEVRQHWPLLTAAIQKCHADGGLTSNNLDDLLKVVVDFGKGQITWTGELMMDGAGKLYATLRD